MATPVGGNSLTALSRRYILPELVDVIYGSNPIFFRLNQSRRREIPGGYQMEVPVLYQKHTTGGAFEGWDVVDVTPQDNFQTAAWDWKQHYSHVSINKRDLIRANSPEAVFNLVQSQFEQAEIDIADKLGTGLQSDGVTNTKEIDGLEGAVDDAGVLTTYAGINRTSNTWWRANDDSSTVTLSVAALRSMFFNCKSGGRAPTLIYSDVTQYSRFLALGEADQTFEVGAGGHDPQLYSAGFDNALMMQVPWVEDSHAFVPTSESNSAITFLNEFYIDLGVNPGADFYVWPFESPVDQVGWTSKIDWAGNLIVRNPARQGKISSASA